MSERRWAEGYCLKKVKRLAKNIYPSSMDTGNSVVKARGAGEATGEASLDGKRRSTKGISIIVSKTTTNLRFFK